MSLHTKELDSIKDLREIRQSGFQAMEAPAINDIDPTIVNYAQSIGEKAVVAEILVADQKE